MVQLTLSREDGSVLRSLLEAKLKDLRHEIAHTDSRRFREQLDLVVNAVEGMADQLSRQLPSESDQSVAGPAGGSDLPRAHREPASARFADHLRIPAAVTRYLREHGVSYSVIHHRVAHTARGEAAAAHVPRHEWAKAVVCIADGQPTIAVVPADRVVDMRRLGELAGVRELRLATEGEMASLYRECEAGAVPPLGPLYGHRVFVDEGLTSSDEVAFCAGSHGDAIRMRYRDFEALVKPTVASFGRLH